MSQEFVAIGDIHGCPKTLNALLDSLKTYSNRKFIFVGDYIDRGPNSAEVVSSLIAFSAKHSCVFLRGNHEQMLLDVQNGNSIAQWSKNGGKMTIQSYMNENKKYELPYQHFHFYRNTRLFYESDSYVFVHGGLDPECSIAENIADESSHESFMWQRDHLHERNFWEKTVVFGHTPMSSPLVKNNMIGIDTGCVFKNLHGLGKLTAVLLPEVQFIQQDCIDEPKPY